MQASTAGQQHALCTLDTLAEPLECSGLASAAVLVIGDVVRAAPLFGTLKQNTAVLRHT